MTHKHTYMVTYSKRFRDLLRKRYWLRCWECELCVGPFTRVEDALKAKR